MSCTTNPIFTVVGRSKAIIAGLLQTVMAGLTVMATIYQTANAYQIAGLVIFDIFPTATTWPTIS